MLVVLALAAIAVIAGVTVVAMGRGGELKEFPPDVPPLDLPEAGRLGAVDFMALQLPVSLVGYHTQSVDETLNRVAGALSERDTRIAVLEQRVSELLAGRLQARHELNPGLPVPVRSGREAPYELSGTGGYGASEELSNGPAVAVDTWRRGESSGSEDFSRPAENPTPANSASDPDPDPTTGFGPATAEDPATGSTTAEGSVTGSATAEDPATGSATGSTTAEGPVTGSDPVTDPAPSADPDAVSGSHPDPVTDSDSTPVSGVRSVSRTAPGSDSVPDPAPAPAPDAVRVPDSAGRPGGDRPGQERPDAEGTR